MRPVVVNTTVVSNFAAIDQLIKLKAIFNVQMPVAVYHEIRQGLEHGYSFYEGIDQHIAPWSPIGWIQLTPLAGDAELQDLRNLPDKLHEGEAECLVLAKHRNWLFLTDDLAARKAAAVWQIPYSGTIGCLVRMIKTGVMTLDQGNDCLEQMKQHNYRSPVYNLDTLISS